MGAWKSFFFWLWDLYWHGDGGLRAGCLTSLRREHRIRSIFNLGNEVTFGHMTAELVALLAGCSMLIFGILPSSGLMYQYQL